MNLFISNIDYTISEDDLTELFSKYGKVESVKILIDLESKKSKGYGFVLMADTDSGILAIQNIDKMELNGRPISVQVARPRPDANSAPSRPKSHDFRSSGERRPMQRDSRPDYGDGPKLSKTGRKLRPRKPRSDSDDE